MKKLKIYKNAIKCNLCGDIVESKSVHDYVPCSCGACAADGGKEYLRRTAPSRDSFTELAEYEEVEYDEDE